MEIKNRDWSLTLGGANRGKDIEREIQVRTFQSQFGKVLDAFKAGDNQNVELPVTVNGKFIDTHVLSAPDLDPTAGRILVDMSEGKIVAQPKADPFKNYKNQSTHKAVIEFNPASGQLARYSGSSTGLEFEASFHNGALGELTTKATDGSYSESLKFSEDGKTVTFHSEEQVKDGKKPSDSEWFLSLT